jgi:GNAT superfamily N-acetyltransferase
MQGDLTIRPLALHPEPLPVLLSWFEAEWPEWYGSGRGDAARDLEAYSNQGSLPVGMVALRDGAVCGIAVLKAESISSHKHLSPWAAAGLVDPALRGQGIGLRLVLALEEQAKALGFPRIYCGTSTADNLLRRANWQFLESITHEGHALSIYEKALL